VADGETGDLLVRAAADDPSPRIAGRCPMGCGETLHLYLEDRIQCFNLDCPDPELPRRSSPIARPSTSSRSLTVAGRSVIRLPSDSTTHS